LTPEVPSLNGLLRAFKVRGFLIASPPSWWIQEPKSASGLSKGFDLSSRVN